jgi:hypothetical protein
MNWARANSGADSGAASDAAGQRNRENATRAVSEEEKEDEEEEEPDAVSPAAAGSPLNVSSDSMLPVPYSLTDLLAKLTSREDPLWLYRNQQDLQMLLFGGNTRTPDLPIETETVVWCIRGSVAVNNIGDDAQVVIAEGEIAIVPERLDHVRLSDEEGSAALVVFRAGE